MGAEFDWAKQFTVVDSIETWRFRMKPFKSRASFSLSLALSIITLAPFVPMFAPAVPTPLLESPTAATTKQWFHFGVGIEKGIFRKYGVDPRTANSQRDPL